MPCSPVLGRLSTAAIFRLDNCMRPIYGEGAGYFDDCFAAFSSSDNMDEGEAFTRRCANGNILYHEDGQQSLQNVEVSIDFNAEPAESFMVEAGLVEPIENDGAVIGFTRCTIAKSNLLVAVWQEVLGSDACDDEDGGEGGHRLHLFPLKNARLTLEGDLGSAESYMRITGTTVPTANLGAGPIPLLSGPSGPVYAVDDLEVCHHTVLTSGVAAPPDDCGVIDTVAPAEG